MKRTVLIIIWIIGICGFAKSQNFPFLTKNINTLVNGGVYLNGSYYIVGYYADTTFGRLGISSYISKTNTYSVPFNTFEININSIEWHNLIADEKAKAISRGILSTGYSLDTFDRTYAVLHIQDTGGAVVLDKRYLMGSGDYAIAPGAAIECGNKDFLMVGKRKYNQLYFIRTDDTGAIKYNKNINVLWGYFGWPHSVVELNNGDFLIAVDDFYDTSPPSVGAALPIKTLLIRTDSTGTEVWRWLDTSNSSSASHSFQKMSDGNYVSCGKQITVRDLVNKTVGYQGLMIKWDSTFKEVYRFTNQNTMSDTGGTEFLDVVVLPNGDYILCGSGGDAFTYKYKSISGFLIKLDKDGNIKWRKFYRTQKYEGAYNNHYLYDLDILPNGDIVAIGEINPNSSAEFGQQGWLLQVDSNGCVVDTAWCGYDNIEVEPTNYNNLGNILSVYPNPSKDIVHLQLNDFGTLNLKASQIEVYDAMGNLIAHKSLSSINSQPNDMELNIQSFHAGIYFVRVLDAYHRPIANAKFVKE